MERKAGILTRLGVTRVEAQQGAGLLLRSISVAVAIALVLFLSLYNLTNYPVTWFDEGSHLHVPKALVRFGVYADYSSEGFRYYGPTVGVGPTVMLPIAAAFKLFGIGLLQARLVMVLYLLAAIYAFYRLALVLGGRRLAWVATALLVTSRGVSLIEYGRQVLGEVPGLFFMATGLALWLASWEKAGLRRLVLVGLLLGLSVVTKNQYLLVIETFEPEMGFLTDHRYHFAPTVILQHAVRHVWLGGPPPSEGYDFVQREHPDYVLVGPFARWIDLYPAEMLAERYQRVVQFEASWPLGYELYAAISSPLP